MPEQVTLSSVPGEQLEVGVPDPGDVAAVGGAVVERDPEVESGLGGRAGLGLEAQRSQHLVRSRGVLDQQDRNRLGRHLDRLHAPEHGLDGLEARLGAFEPDAEAKRRSEGGEGVVDVVEARQRQLQAQGALRRRDRRGRAAHPVQLDLRRGDLRARPGRLAVVAVVVTEVPDEGALVDVGRAAAAAVLGIVGVLELGQSLGRVLDPEVGDAGASSQLAVAAEIGDEGIVGVEHELQAAGTLRDHLGPFVGEMLELSVAVELVAKEVAEHDQPGIELFDHAWQPGLVDLEQALAAALFEQRRGHAPAHVRSGVVVDGPAPGSSQGRRDHPCRRRLAVGGADDRRPGRERAAEVRDRLGLHPQQKPAGQRRPAAAAAAAAERTGGAGERQLGTKGRAGSRAGAHRGTSTRSARGSSRIVTGRSARWSPSA